jgi:hypothetical protein
MLALNTRGRNRFVLLTRSRAYKFPSLRCWRDFLFGLLNNQREAELGRSGSHAHCPVLWYIPGGWLVVMPRVRVMSELEFAAHKYALPALAGVECKPDSWGWLDGVPVAVDYGWE